MCNAEEKTMYTDTLTRFLIKGTFAFLRRITVEIQRSEPQICTFEDFCLTKSLRICKTKQGYSYIENFQASVIH